METSRHQWYIYQQAVAELTGPSFCKAYVRAVLSEAVTIFAERFGIVLPVVKTSII